MTQHYTAQKSTAERNAGLLIQNRALLAMVARLEADLAISQAKNNNVRKLDKSDVVQIRRIWDNRSNVPVTQKEIADHFGINAGTVSRIVNKKYHAGVAA